MPDPYRAALITGASRGIGAAIARALPAETALLLSGRDGAALDTLAADLSASGRTVTAHPADLRDGAARAALAAAADAMGVDLLVNNAGAGSFAPVRDTGPDAALAVTDVNVTAVVDLTHRLLPGMLARAEGDKRRAGIMVVASVVGFMPLPWFSVYAASKAFDLHFAEGLAEEMRGAPLDVLALCPGSTRTDFHVASGMPFSPEAGTASAEQVAAEGLAALGRKTVHVVSAQNKLAAFMQRLAPRRLIGRGLGRAMLARYGRTEWRHSGGG